MVDEASAVMRTAAEICNPVQVATWKDELLQAISEEVRDDLTYDDVVDLNVTVQRELTRIIGDAFGMAWTEIQNT